MASAEEQDDGPSARMSEPLTLQTILRTLGSRLSCKYFVMTTDTEDQRGTGDRFKVSLVSDNPNPCSMDELACSIPRSTYMSVGLSRDSVRTEAILMVKSSDETFTVHDATKDDMSTATMVPPFNSRIYSNGAISVDFYDIPSSLMGDSPDQSIRVPGTAFGSSARAVVANMLSRMRWLRRQTIDDMSLKNEDYHYLYGRDPFYGADLATPKIRLISPDDRADSKPLLPTRIEIKGIGVGTLTDELLEEAYNDLSPAEKTLYNAPTERHTFERMKSALATWRLSYDRIESSKSEWMPFRKPYNAQLTATGRKTKKSRGWRSVQVLETQTMAEIRQSRIFRTSQLRQTPEAPDAPQGQDGQQPAGQTGGDGAGKDASNDLGNTRLESNHAFYVALEQEVGTEADRRQLYKVEISILAPAPFKGFDTLSIKSAEGEMNTDHLVRRLGQYLSRIPDRARIEPANTEDVASRNPYLMSLRNMLVISPDVDAIDALDQLFANKTSMLSKYSSDSVDTMAKFIERMSAARLLNTAVKIAKLASEIETHLGAQNVDVLKTSFRAVYATMALTAKLCSNFTAYIRSTASRFSEVDDLMASLVPTDSLKGETPDTDEQNVSIAVDTLTLVDRVKEPKNPEATSVSPASDDDLKRVIYRAICRLQCSLHADTNRKLDQKKYEGHPYGLYVVYRR